MKKSVLIIGVFTVFIISGNNLKAQIAHKPAATTSVNSGGDINIEVPDFADPEVNNFFHAYTAHIIEYVKAIRLKDKARINTAMEKDIQFTDEKIGNIDDKIEQPNEVQKAMELSKQLQPYVHEILKSEYYKEEVKKFLAKPDSKN